MSLHRLIALTTFATLTACGQTDEPTTTTTSETTSETGTTETGTTITTTTATTTTTPVTGSALMAHIGLAITEVVNTGGATEWDGISYDGTESERYEDDKGNILCEVTYDVNQTAENTTCDVCWWAFDLEQSNATITAELEGGCSTILGVDASNVGDMFDGITKSYGYNGDYYGHATVLFALEEEEWDSVSFGYYVDKTGEFSYQREFGQIEY
jgi:hypothetical protein